MDGICKTTDCIEKNSFIACARTSDSLLALYENCALCPRQCHINRFTQKGFCGCGADLLAARSALHFWEEPCISGHGGCGTIFFTGCTLKCCFCQNYPISQEGVGKKISSDRLAQIMLRLQEQGAENISLITATQYLPSILPALDQARPYLRIPVVYNCGGYETIETLRLLDGYIDIYLPDLKYFSPSLSYAYSGAEDYFEYASRAIPEMIRQTGAPVWAPRTESSISSATSHTGQKMSLLKKGTLIRHMVLPGQKNDSILLLHWMADHLPKNGYLFSLLSQYTPFYHAKNHPEIYRRVTSYEYQKVLDAALSLGLDQGYMQKRSSARKEYTPPFDLQGL